MTKNGSLPSTSSCFRSSENLRRISFSRCALFIPSSFCYFLKLSFVGRPPGPSASIRPLRNMYKATTRWKSRARPGNGAVSRLGAENDIFLIARIFRECFCSRNTVKPENLFRRIALLTAISVCKREAKNSTDFFLEGSNALGRRFLVYSTVFGLRFSLSVFFSAVFFAKQFTFHEGFFLSLEHDSKGGEDLSVMGSVSHGDSAARYLRAGNSTPLYGAVGKLIFNM